MKKLHISIIGLAFLFLTSCKEEVEVPKVTYDGSGRAKELAKADSSQIQIADLPLQMEGTDYLIHPVADLSIRERGVKSRYGSSSVNDLSFTISNYGEFEITGFFQNLK